MNFKLFLQCSICFYQNQTSNTCIAILLWYVLKCLCIFLPKYLSKTKLWIWWKLNVYMIFFPPQTSDHFMRRERETPVGTANDESMTWHEMCWASFVYLIKICREGTRPVSFLSKKQWYLFFWSVLINTRYLPSLHILERVQTYKEIIISIISSFSFTPKAQAHSQDHYLAPTDILSIFFYSLSLSLFIADQRRSLYIFFFFKFCIKKVFAFF